MPIMCSGPESIKLPFKDGLQSHFTAPVVG